jgi:hypothetical protein
MLIALMTKNSNGKDESNKNDNMAIMVFLSTMNNIPQSFYQINNYPFDNNSNRNYNSFNNHG